MLFWATFSITSAFLCVNCCSPRRESSSWHYRSEPVASFLCFRYNSKACGVPGGKHGKARPPLQSLQDEPPPQMWEWSGTAALHGQAGKMHDSGWYKTLRHNIDSSLCLFAFCSLGISELHKVLMSSATKTDILELAVWPFPTRMCLFRNHTQCVSLLVHLWAPSILVILLIIVISSLCLSVC